VQARLSPRRFSSPAERLLAVARSRLESDARVRYVAVSALLAALTIVFTWPLLAHFGSGVLGAPGDVPNGIRVWWSLAEQHGNPFTTARDLLINAPEGVSVNRAVYIGNGLFQGFWWFGGLTIGWVAAYNLFDLLVFVASGIAAFVLFDRLRFGVWPALFGAYVFTFNPNHIEKMYSSAPLAATGVLPLVLVALFVRRRSPTGRNAIFVGLALLAAFYLNSYLGLFAVWMAGVFIAVEIALPAGAVRRRDVIRSYYFTAVTLVLGLGPVAWSWASNVATVQGVAATRTAPFTGGFASPQLFLLPGPRNPVLGGPMRSWLHGHLAWEGTMFFGYTTLILAVVGVVVALVRRRSGNLDRERFFYVVFAVTLVVTSIWAALPPSIDVLGLHLPVLQEVLTRVTTLFRVFARFGVLIGLGVIMLAVFALASVSRTMLGRGVCVAALVLVAFELYVPRPDVVSVHHDLVGITTPQIGQSLSGTPVLLSLADPPSYVSWLEEHPGGIVADYPSPAAPDGRWEWKNDYYQTTHHHPLWQTTSTSDSAQDSNGTRAAAVDLDAPATPSVLDAAGVRYVIEHQDEYRARNEPVPNPAVTCGLAPVARFPRDSVVIYDVTAHARGFVTRGAGFDSIANPQLWPESKGFAWIGASAHLTVFWPSTGHVLVEGSAVSLGQPRTLFVRDVTGNVVATWAIGTDETSFHIRLGIEPYFNTFTLTTTPGPVTRGFGDDRKVSIAISQMRVLSGSGSSTLSVPTEPGCKN
jgi:hypothetical protein